jgi:hypothetical protein
MNAAFNPLADDDNPQVEDYFRGFTVDTNPVFCASSLDAHMHGVIGAV